jgi:poly(A)-specific ribonuclease
MYDKFIGPIPSTMEEFINEVHKTFPNIIDTTHIMNANQTVHNLMKNKSRSLSSAFSSLCPTISSGFSHGSACVKTANIQVQADDNGYVWFHSYKPFAYKRLSFVNLFIDDFTY